MTMTAQEAATSAAEEYDLVPAPADAPEPEILGEPTSVHIFRAAEGHPIHYQINYWIEGQLRPSFRSWCKIRGDWVKKALPKPRPLYNLHHLAERPDAPVVVVDGVSSADAATSIVGAAYVAVTWAAGLEAWRNADWRPLAGRDVVLWPAMDDPSIKAMDGVFKLLPRRAAVKLIDPADQGLVMDAVQARDDGLTGRAWSEWARDRVKVLRSREDIEAEPERPEPSAIKRNVRESVYSLHGRMGITVSEKGIPEKTLLNAQRSITNNPDLSDKIWYDKFHAKIFTNWQCKTREWEDADTLRITKHVQEDLQLNFTDLLMEKAVALHAFEHQRNEPLEWLESLEWDGKARIHGMFPDMFGAPETLYSTTIGGNFMISMVARIARPGCKVDNMVVLEGKQGAFKSSALEVLGGNWYAEMTESVNNKDFFQILQGKMILEIGEMDAFSRAEASRIKQIVSCRTDRYRASYGRHPGDYKRQCLFVGTTNDDHYLRDTTGGRRFWPVKCGRINLEMLARDREQLFAEAYARFNDGAPWWEIPEMEAAHEQEQRRQVDTWEEIIRSWLVKDGMFNTDNRVELTAVLGECLSIEPGKQEFKHAMRVQRAMRSLGYYMRMVKKPDGGYDRFFEIEPTDDERVDYGVE